MPAADLTFTIDTDATTGEETITVTELKQARRQGPLCMDPILARLHDAARIVMVLWVQRYGALLRRSGHAMAYKLIFIRHLTDPAGVCYNYQQHSCLLSCRWVLGRRCHEVQPDSSRPVSAD